MNSITKNRKTNEEILKMIEPVIETNNILSLSELTKGYFNATYLIETVDGKRFVLKIAPKKSTPVMKNEKDIMLSEVNALKILENIVDIPVPKLVYFSEKSNYFDGSYIVMQWMPGVDYQTAGICYTEDQKNVISEKLGDITSKIHQIHGEKFGKLGDLNAQFPTWETAFFNMLNNLLEDGIDANVSLPFSYEYINRILEQGKQVFNDVTVPSLIHGDLWPGNILIQNGSISSVIDFERSFWGDPVMEYPFGLMSNKNAFIRGYNRDNGFKNDAYTCVRRTIYNIYHYLIVKIEKPFRGFPESSHNLLVDLKIKKEIEFLKSQY